MVLKINKTFNENGVFCEKYIILEKEDEIKQFKEYYKEYRKQEIYLLYFEYFKSTYNKLITNLFKEEYDHLFYTYIDLKNFLDSFKLIIDSLNKFFDRGNPRYNDFKKVKNSFYKYPKTLFLIELRNYFQHCILSNMKVIIKNNQDIKMMQFKVMINKNDFKESLDNYVKNHNNKSKKNKKALLNYSFFINLEDEINVIPYIIILYQYTTSLVFYTFRNSFSKLEYIDNLAMINKKIDSEKKYPMKMEDYEIKHQISPDNLNILVNKGIITDDQKDSLLKNDITIKAKKELININTMTIYSGLENMSNCKKFRQNILNFTFN